MVEKKKEPKEQIDFDKVLERIGTLGLYQILAVTLLCMVQMTPGLHAMASVFQAALPPFACGSTGGATNVTAALSYTDGDAACTRVNHTFGVSYNATTTTTCNQFRYDTSVFTSTIVTKWDLVCDSAWLRASSTSLFMLGNLIGVIIFGHVADRFGRKCLFWANLLLVGVGSAVAFAPTFWSYTMLRLATGALTMGIVAVSFTHGVEIIGAEHRVVIGVGTSVAFALGISLLSVLAFFVRDYHWLQLIISLFALIFVGPLYWVGESPRWMLRQGKYKEAEREIRRMAKMNGRELPDDLWSCSELLVDARQQGTENDTLGQNVFALLRPPRMRCNTVNLWYIWMVISMVYYGLSLGSSDLAGSPFLNLGLAGLVELPAFVFAYPAVQKFGRKPVLVGSLLVGGVTCFLVPAIPSGWIYHDPRHIPWLIITFTMAGKFFVSVAFGDIYIYTGEAYPTPVRAIGVGAGSMFARVGSLLAPLIADMSNMTWQPLTQVVFGTLSVVAGCLAIMLPETLGHKLPETMEDGEKFAKTGLCCLGHQSAEQVNGELRMKDKEEGVLLKLEDEETDVCDV